MKKLAPLFAALFCIVTGLTNAQSNQLLGMTANGGANNGGTIFKINYNGSGFKTLYSFKSATGRNPYGTLARANNGLFYGTADSGGTNKGGVIFSFDTSTNQYTVVYNFSKKDKNGYYPAGTLFKASNGLLYGMTAYGGTSGYGVLFSFNTANNAYTRLVNFNGINGGSPFYNGLMQASNGLLYGMTPQGGYNSDGVLFSFNPVNNTYNSYNITYDYDVGGVYPNGRLIQAADGKLYTTTVSSHRDASSCIIGEGALLSFNIGSNSITNVYQFRGTCIALPNPLGAYLYGSLTEKSPGVFYGLVSGENDYSNPGNIFKFESANSTATQLFDFSNQANSGSLPYGTLLTANDGNLYGMTWAGGSSNFGTIFSFNPSNNSFIKIHDFDGVHGANPYADLITCLTPRQAVDILGPAAACFGSTVTYSINPIAGATSYKWTVPAGSAIQGATNGTNIKVVFGSTGGAITVKAKNACGFSPVRSKSILLHACTLTSNQIAIELKEGISPNPTKGPVTLSFSSSTSDRYSVKVTDMFGKKLINMMGKAEPGMNSINFDLSNFAKGIYLVEWSQDNHKKILKKVVLY